MAARVCMSQLQAQARVVRSATFCSTITRHVPAAARRLSSVSQRPALIPLKITRGLATACGGAVMAVAAQTLHDLQAKDIDGKTIDLSQYKGKVVLVVNVASQCGFTKQYTGLAELHNKYKNQGFEVLAFPCNQFGGQEPGDNAQIKAFAKNKGASFQMFDKIDVNGGNASPVWQFLKSEKGGFLTADVKWNFSKFLVDKDGKVVKRYGSTAEPDAIEADVKALL